MRARTSASHASGSTSFNLAVMISVATRSVRSAPRSEPAKSHDRRPRAKPLRARSAALLERQIRPSWRKRAKPASKHVVDRLGHGGRARQAGALVAQPDLKLGHQGGALISAHLETLNGGAAVDEALDLEQSVDAPHGLKRDRRDHDGVLAAPRIGSDVGELEELPACMRPTECWRDRALRTAGVVKPVVAAVSIGLQDAAEAAKVTLGMGTGAVARRIVEGGWRRPAAKSPIVPDIGPDAARHGFSLC